MILRILPHATLCEASGRLIILDIRRDRYLAVPPSLDEPFRKWLRTGNDTLPEPVHRLLLRSNILAPDDPEPRLEIMDAPRSDVLDLTIPSPSLSSPSEIARVALAVGLTSIQIRYARLQNILGRHAQRRATSDSPRPGDVNVHAARFDRTRRLIPAKRNCLLDTLALDSWLGNRPECRVVFGVTAAPFAAHCWLQRGTTVLNDSPDKVSRFTPILTV